MTGSLDGQTVTLNMTTGAKNEIPVTFVGTLDQAGTTITGMWHFAVSGEERSGDFYEVITQERTVDRYPASDG